jgi:hypothetical protein
MELLTGFIINIRTARALGIEFPATLPGSADFIVE